MTLCFRVVLPYFVYSYGGSVTPANKKRRNFTQKSICSNGITEICTNFLFFTLNLTLVNLQPGESKTEEAVMAYYLY